MNRMIGRRAALRAGRTLNEVADQYRRCAANGVYSAQLAREAAEAVRVANEILYQYYAIPRDIREQYHQEVGADGVPMQDMAEE